jgi:hypothetical protein
MPDRKLRKPKKLFKTEFSPFQETRLLDAKLFFQFPLLLLDEPARVKRRAEAA